MGLFCRCQWCLAFERHKSVSRFVWSEWPPDPLVVTLEWLGIGKISGQISILWLHFRIYGLIYEISLRRDQNPFSSSIPPDNYFTLFKIAIFSDFPITNIGNFSPAIVDVASSVKKITVASTKAPCFWERLERRDQTSFKFPGSIIQITLRCSTISSFTSFP